MKLYNYFQVRWLNGYSYVSDAPNNINLFIESLQDKLRPEGEAVTIGYSFDEKTSISYGILVFQVFIKAIKRNCNYYHVVAYCGSDARSLNKEAFKKLFTLIYGENIESEITAIYNRVSTLEKSKGRFILDKYCANRDSLNMVAAVYKQEFQEEQNQIFEETTEPPLGHFSDIEGKSKLSKNDKPMKEKSKLLPLELISFASLLISIIALGISIYFRATPKIIDGNERDIGEIIKAEVKQQISELGIKELVKDEVKGRIKEIKDTSPNDKPSANTADELIKNVLNAIQHGGSCLNKSELMRAIQNDILAQFSDGDQNKIRKLQAGFNNYDTDKDAKLCSGEVQIAVF